MMAESTYIVLFDFKAPAKQFVAPVAEEQTQFELFSFLHAIEHITRMVVHRLINQVHRFKTAELRKAVAAFLDFDAVERLATLYAHPSSHGFSLGPFFAPKMHGADVDAWTAFYVGFEVNLDKAALRASLNGVQFHVRVGI